MLPGTWTVAQSGGRSAIPQHMESPMEVASQRQLEVKSTRVFRSSRHDKAVSARREHSRRRSTRELEASAARRHPSCEATGRRQ